MDAERSAGLLGMDDPLRNALARYRVHMAITGPPTLALEAVRDVERQLGRSLPDEVLALLAATGRDPYQAAVLTADAREEHGLPRRYVAFGHDSPAAVYWCIPYQPEADGSRPVVQWSAATLSIDGSWRSLPSFLHARFNLDRRLTSAERAQLNREKEGLAPRLTETDEPEPQRVFHPIFGVGTVLREVSGKLPKVDVDFGPAGRRLVLASYVRTVELPADGGDENARPPDRSTAPA